MKTTTLLLILFLTGLDLWAQIPPDGNTPATTPANATPERAETTFDFQGVDVSQALDVYAKLVGRTLLRAGLPSASIVLKTETPLTKTEAIEALQAVLALNGISVVNVGDKFVKVLPSDQANSAAAEFNNTDVTNLPELGSYVTRIVQLKYVKPSEIVQAIQPFAKLNSITPLDSNGILIIRDYAENVKRMLEMIDQVDISSPAEYVSEVIPIRYALADDIANALNSLGGSGSGATVSIGGSSSSTSTTGNGLRTPGSTTGGGFNSNQGGNGLNGTQSRTFGGTTGTPSTGQTSFQQRLQAIIQRAAGGQQDQIQLFGQTKIIADERSNSLLVFATRQDMDMIKSIVDKLDVLLSQVLIESVIMEVSLDKTLNTGVSAVQNPSAINAANFKGTGSIYNGPSFFSFLTNSTLSNAGTNLEGGLSYFGQIGNSDYEIALQAAASDNSITIIQKPRIQTFQAQKASFFVGQTVPYVTGSTYGSAYGNSSSYAQLSVGVELDVTPFINPDGLVVMQIDEEIDDINGSTYIQGVGDVPNTDKRTLSSEVAVKDRDTIILGGIINSQKTLNKSGVPVLQDIPLLGVLFSSRSSDKSRDELLVLMRPTVLKTPELAAIQAKKEEEQLPGIHSAEAQDNQDELKQVQAEQKLQEIQDQKDAIQAAKDAARAKKQLESIPTNAPPNQIPDPNAAPTMNENDGTQNNNPASGLY
jgi:general secretion pathway protein D